MGKERVVRFFFFGNLKGFGGKMERTIGKGMLADYKKGTEEFSGGWSKQRDERYKRKGDV